MNCHQKKLSISTRGKYFHSITCTVEEAVTESGIKTGLCTIFIPHTSASLVIQENADPDVLVDLSNFFAQLVPESGRYIHSTEGPDDMPAHIRSALTKTSEQIPINKGRLMLGTWQGIYLWEHRSSNHKRDVIIHISGV
ncbi:MAG: secondary thiamine-phosphate synthase enzyme YjbQ [cyanobacterium endosymbiont of Rhopalodia sterrenbergii]